MENIHHRLQMKHVVDQNNQTSYGSHSTFQTSMAPSRTLTGRRSLKQSHDDQTHTDLSLEMLWHRMIYKVKDIIVVVWEMSCFG